MADIPTPDDDPWPAAGGAGGPLTVAGRPVPPSPDTGFLSVPEASAAVQHIYDEDVDEVGYVMNQTRLWAHQPALQQGLFALIGDAVTAAGLTFRQRAVLITAAASARDDAYCSLAWGARLAEVSSPDTAAGVVRGDDVGLDEGERALAAWARAVVRDPNGVAAADVEALRGAGLDDARIVAVTTLVALRLAFATVNDALGARPDHALHDSVPVEVRTAVTFGRPPAAGEG